MLDKTIPYYNVLMRYDGPLVFNSPKLDDEYSFCGYREGDELRWAEMEVDNNDFDTYENAVHYFRDKYCKNINKLQERFIGISDSKGYLLGSVICWDDEKENDRVSSVHWLVTDPKAQGKGLGKALVKMLIKRFSDLNALPIYLHTQPWSYRAIGIYHSEGFKLLKKDSFRGYENQSEEALPILEQLMPKNMYTELVSNIQ